MKRLLYIILALAALLIPRGNAPGAEDALPPSEGTLPESQAALNVLDSRDLALLQSAEVNFQQSDWAAGVRKLANVLARSPDALIPSPDGHAFTSVWEYFHNRMRRLPPYATAAYRAAEDSLPSQLAAAEEKMDAAALGEIARDHLFTGPGRAALNLLIEYYYESGRYPEALACIARFEKYLAFERSDSVRVAEMKLVCLARIGRSDALESAARAAVPVLEKEEVVWQGEKMGFGDFMERLKTVARAVERREDVGPLLPARLAALPLIFNKGTASGAGEYPAEEVIPAADMPEWQASAPFTDIYPVLNGDTMYLRLRSSLFALDVGHFERPRWKMAAGALGAITLGDGKAKMAAICAVAAAKDRIFTTVIDKGPQRLGCFDAKTGRLLWLAHGKAGGKSPIDNSQVASAPVCIGDSVFVTAVVPRGEQGDDYYLLRVNAADGLREYATFLCTRIASIKGGEVLCPPAPAVMADGTIYVATNAGAVCAVDMMSGKLRWATLYNRANSVTATRAKTRFERALHREQSFAYGPPVVSEGVLVVAPPEADNLIALDADTGRTLWLRDNSDRSLAHLLGVAIGKAILSGRKIAAFDIHTGAPAWPNMPDANATGRGVLAGDRIVIQDGDANMIIFNARDGGIVARYAASDLFRPPVPDKMHGFAGNLVLLRNAIYSVSRTRITIYPLKP